MRHGDFIVLLNMTLNLSAAGLYAWQGHWTQTLYWLAALQLNLALLWMK